MPRPINKPRVSRSQFLRAVGSAVHAAREQKGWTMHQLAEKSCTSMSAIYYIEAGERSPNIYLLDRVAKALDTTVADLLT